LTAAWAADPEALPPRLAAREARLAPAENPRLAAPGALPIAPRALAAAKADTTEAPKAALPAAVEKLAAVADGLATVAATFL
jgi:hypothetical protein